jgi:hypothetical protein
LSDIAPEKKLYLLNQCFQSSLKGKDWEKLCKQSLDIIRTLADTQLLPTVLKILDDKYVFTEIVAHFNAQLQTKVFGFERKIINFYEKYLRVESTSRIPLSLVTYANNLKGDQSPNTSQELQRLIRSILEGTVQQERYHVENNPHLECIAENYPAIFYAWQQPQAPMEKNLDDRKNWSINFLSFLQEKILRDRHFPEASPSLMQYLLDPKSPYIIEDLQEADKEVFLLCKDLCSSSIDFTSKLSILRKLSNALNENEFKNDIQALLKSLTAKEQLKSILIVDTDDWQDLFLSGTEVLGSCQRIDGDPSYNVCLMAYVLDGKNRMLAIKDSTNQKILARCILRLLWDTKNNRPALFQERIYPYSCSQEYRDLLNTLAVTRAKDLGLELFTLNQNGSLGKKSSLESLGSCCSYEYADASLGVMRRGVFVIPDAQAVTLSC